ncbi:MAG TPA: copper resistance protein CopC [Acidisphaera sp.]|nr:copper resistance protein CopC [Acidisphaera sp.]
MASGLGLALLVAVPGMATARPVQMRESTPVAETILHGNNAQYVIRFDGPVNHFASRMVIMQGDRIVQTLTPLRDSAVDVLYASGRVPSPGRYALHWEAVSADGDTSKGDIPFSVEP